MMDHLARRVALRFTNAHKSASRPSDPKAYMHKYVDPKFDSTLGTLKEFSVQLGVLKGSLMELMSDVPETQDLAGELREIVSKEHLHLTPMKDAMVKKIVALQKLMGSLGSGKTGSNVNRIATSSASTLYKTLATSLDVAIDLFESVEKGSAGEALAREAMNGLHQTLEALKKFEHLRTSPRTAEGPHTTGKVAAGEVNVPKLDRLVESIEKEVKQMRTSLDLYTKDPGKYKPQLDNLANAASTVESTVGVIHRLIDKA
jgi:hypothetical protein